MRDDRVPLLDRKLLDRRHELDAGIVDEDIDRTEGLFAERDHFGDLGGLGHVGGRMHRLDLEIGLDAGALLLDIGRRAHAVENDIGAGAGESARISQSDAAGRSGHHRGLACQSTHFIHSCLPVGGIGTVPREIVSHHGFAGLRPFQPFLVTHRQMHVAHAGVPVLDHADMRKVVILGRGSRSSCCL